VRERPQQVRPRVAQHRALAGLWLVLSLPTFGQLVALIALVAITSYGELRSISALVQRTPALRGLDSLGRPS